MLAIARPAHLGLQPSEVVGVPCPRRGLCAASCPLHPAAQSTARMLEPESEVQSLADEEAALPMPEDSGLVGEDGAFAAGCSVVLTGVQSEPELNGRIGVIRSFSEAKGRYTIVVEGRDRAVGLKPSNVFIPAVPVDSSGTSADFVVDVSAFMGGVGGAPGPAERRLVAASWDATFRSIGFARIVGHGAPHAHSLPCHSFSHTNLKSPCAEQGYPPA
eukprot:COSAG03_NODE_736_length_6038_cov_155.990908_7_plen_217_part_00